MASPVFRIACVAFATAGWLVLPGRSAPAWAAGSGTAAGPAPFDTLLVAPAMRLDLLERAALQRNPTLAAAAAAAAEAAARADATGRFMSPVLEGMVAPQAIGNGDVGVPGYQIGLSQSLPLWGTRGLEKRAA
ncbi:MAG TPA: TolC family protein, partial [Candidatus Eisenbacteria bacterium]|nr:TolC family protein [Candidatus Eisenbacteria bacterium]